MLKVLVKKQLAEIYNQTFRRRDKTGRSGKRKRTGKSMTVLLIFLMFYMAAMFAAMAYGLGIAFFEVKMGWLYYLLMGAAAIAFGTLGSVFSTYYTLYLAKDNDLLLSMPIPVRDLILSRLLGVYVIGLVYSGLISLPAVAVGLVLGSFTLSRLLCGLGLVLLVSLVVLGLSCLLGWVVARLSLRLKNKSYVTVLISLVFLALYFVFYFRVMSRVQELIQSMILMGEQVRDSAYPIYLFGQIGEGDWLALLLWTLGILALLGLIWLGMQKSFLSTATASADGKKAVYREKKGAQTSVSAALLRREWLRFTSSANYMLNCGLGAVMLLGLGVYLLIQGKTLLGYLALLPAAFSDAMPVFCAAACCLLAGMIDITAPSVSLEGKTLWQIQSLPVSPWQALRAKLELHLCVAAAPVLFCAAVLAVLVPATLAQKLLILAAAVLATIFYAVLGLAAGLKMPVLDWSSEVVPIKQSASVLIAVLSGMGLGIAMIGLYFLLGRHIGATGWLSVTVLLLLAADAALFLWLRRSGTRRFAEL